jgi:hypothetical protein
VTVTGYASPEDSDDDAPKSLAQVKLERLRKLEQLRRQRDALLAADPGGGRKALIEQYPTALDFAERFDLRTRRTPALELLARRMREWSDTHDGRLVISIPPQEGKTTLTRWLITWLLVQDPDRRVVFVSFAQTLARQTGREVRNKLTTHPELSLPVDRSHRDATDWGIEGKEGGLYSVGIGGALTGRPADIMIIDDPLRGQADADSDITRENLHEWWSSTSRTRLNTGSPVLIIQTRWHEDDLAGRMIEAGWPHINIPALADGHTEDALDREAGEWLTSARGRSVKDWESTRRDVGERTFAALYQGRPAPLEGGIFKYEWFERWRYPAEEGPKLSQVVVGVDPADTGLGDAAGILVAGTTRDGTIVFVADLSGQLSQAMWARKACLAWGRYEANRIVQEHNLGMRTAIPDAWAVLYRQATALANVPADKLINGDDSRPAEAATALTAQGDHVAANISGLWDVLKIFRRVLEAGPTGPRVVHIAPRLSKRVRAESVAGAFETGRARLVGQFKVLEHEACTWQEGQRSPNRIDVLAMLTTHLESQRSTVKVSRPSAPPTNVASLDIARARRGNVALDVAGDGGRRAASGAPVSPHSPLWSPDR